MDTLSDRLEPERLAGIGGKGSRFAGGAAAAFYLLVALEVIIMITPFAAYFYSVYAPVLGWLEGNAWTAWLTAFFLPHITYTGDLLLVSLALAGPVLLAVGLGLFLVGAGQVYGAKLFRKGVVSGGLYRVIRHPQYLGLAIAGLGLLLYWPRFFILITFVSMLFVYYLLARNEEGRMLRKFGASYAAYLDRTAMFLPGNPGRRLSGWLFGSAPPGRVVLGLYAVVLVVAVGLAVGLRTYSLARVPLAAAGGVVAVGMSPGSPGELSSTLSRAKAHPEVQALLAKYHGRPGHTLVAYVLPQAYMMQHLIADLSEHESHHGKEGGGSAFVAVASHLVEMYALKPLRQLRDGAADPAKRIIFTEALDPEGRSVGPEAALGTSVLRYPLFFADYDGGSRQVTLTMETARRHTWGTIPVPAF
jgi:protein-S-isoprenylcysteine O-methyltransferase Ste14